MPKILMINGPNLNLLGTREVGIYGNQTLKEIERSACDEAEKLGLECIPFQSNSESEIINRIHDAREEIDLIIINPGAFTHTSVAIRDAISGTGVPVIEVHLSNIYQREEFRRHSYIAPVVVGQIAGFGPTGYLLALQAARRILDAP